MTAEERRDFLIGRGWLVASTSIRSGDRFINSMVEELAPRVNGRKPLHFIDLSSGEWCLSGKPWQNWDRGPWHELASDEPAAAPAVPAADRAGPGRNRYRELVQRPLVAPNGRPVDRWFTEADLDWFDQCIDAGFEIVVEPVQLADGYKDRGNQRAVRDGKSYLLLVATRSIMGPQFQFRKLEEFTTPAVTKSVQQPVQQTAPQIAAQVSAPVTPAPVIYQNPEPIAVMGNIKQRSLFA